MTVQRSQCSTSIPIPSTGTVKEHENLYSFHGPAEPILISEQYREKLKNKRTIVTHDSTMDFNIST
jgi:hypothetical protein